MTFSDLRKLGVSTRTPREGGYPGTGVRFTDPNTGESYKGTVGKTVGADDGVVSAEAVAKAVEESGLVGQMKVRVGLVTVVDPMDHVGKEGRVFIESLFQMSEEMSQTE